MRKIFSGLWWLVTAPFRLVWFIIIFPFWSYKKISKFLSDEPEENELVDVVSGIVSDKNVRQAMWDQVEDLRRHLIRSLVALIIGVSISFSYAKIILNYLARHVPEGGLEAMKAIEVTEPIGVFMKISLISGLAISLPYIAFEFWLFAAPGLKPRSRRFGLIAIPLATLLFISGIAFTDLIMMPAALPFMINFLGIQTELRPLSFITFITNVMFWIGLAFEFPLVIYVLTAIGMIKPNVLVEYWRIAMVLIAVLAAAITPTIDPFNMGLVMLPMALLYFISIGLSQIAYRGRVNQDNKINIDKEAE